MRMYDKGDERWVRLVDAFTAFSCYAARGDFDGMCICRKAVVKIMDGLILSESLRIYPARSAEGGEQAELLE